jgi:hypothetical protein
MDLLFPDNLEMKDRNRLIKALVECDCLKTPASRDLVVEDLPKEISSRIKRFPDAITDVKSILQSCRQFDGGLEQFIEVIRDSQDEMTKTWQEVQKIIDEIIAKAQITENLDELGAKLARDMLLTGGALPPESRDQAQQQIEDEKRRHGQSGAPRAQADYLDEVMHRINFSRLQDFLSYGERHYTKDGFAALCVVQHSELMGGRWGLKRIQSWLEGGGKQPKEIHIQPIHNEALDAPMIRSRLATAFAIVPEESLNGISAITQKICGAFHEDRRILITIQPCDEFSDETWSWVLHEFWCAFIQAFQKSQTHRAVRFLLILMTDLPLASADVIAHACDTDEKSFKQEKLVRLPLDYWTEPELLNWLSNHWGNNRTDQQLEALAKKFFLASNGQPSVIYDLCKKHLL